MTTASIPVDLYNPGQVFASLGFLEAASVCCSRVAGRFDWADEANARFVLDVDSNTNPFETVLEFLSKAELRRIAPPGTRNHHQKKKKTKKAAEGYDEAAGNDDLEHSNCFPARKPDPMTLPVCLTYAGQSLNITHWADGSSRNAFKLYAGNRSAAMIARAMLMGTREKPRKGQEIGSVRTKGIRALWEEDRERLAERPFGALTPLAGTFNLDSRGAWTALNVGYSPDKQNHTVVSSPVVELLATVGLENARPLQDRETGWVRYAVWSELLPASLSRPALAGSRFGVPLRTFRFKLLSKGKNNKAVTSAEEDTSL